MIFCRKCRYLFNLYFELRRLIKVAVIDKASKNLLQSDDCQPSKCVFLRQLPFKELLIRFFVYSLNRHLEISSELKPVNASRSIYSLHWLLDNEWCFRVRQGKKKCFLAEHNAALKITFLTNTKDFWKSVIN